MSAQSGSLDLSGRWAGVYYYPDGAPPDFVPTSFRAELIEEGCHLTGRTVELDSWSSTSGDLHAVIEGQRSGLSVAFTKIPDGGRDVIEYVGEVDPDGQTIRGRWHIIADWSGTFEMRRHLGACDVAVARQTSEPLTPR